MIVRMRKAVTTKGRRSHPLAHLRSQRHPRHDGTFPSFPVHKTLLKRTTTARKLPKLSPALVPPPPTSDPSKHQGRVRTTPHVEGQYAAYVYVHVPLSGECQKLGQLLGRAVRYAREVVGEEVVKCDWLRESDGAESLVHDGAELHISLTRPIFLRAHQRDDLKRAIRDAANTQTSYVQDFVPRSPGIT
jgi:hypothetical protein